MRNPITMKRLFDIVCSAFGLLLLVPLFALTALLIFVYDRGPVFYLQQRVGRGGRSFGIYKFRSMHTDADQRGGFSTAANDPRITGIGRVLRRSSIDELPQLLNVLKGDMSLVGPRPDVPKQRVLYTDAEWTERHSVAPGITGLAQATLRSSGTEDQRKALDLEYVRKQSLGFDCRILLLTARQILFVGGN
jgi:lipopolysaccharide/colanic/teichoic acid biosynthesis glycosyltransferase